MKQRESVGGLQFVALLVIGVCSSPGHEIIYISQKCVILLHYLCYGIHTQIVH